MQRCSSQTQYPAVAGRGCSLRLLAGHGIRHLGRTAVECTRHALGDRIGLDVTSVASEGPDVKSFVCVCGGVSVRGFAPPACLPVPRRQDRIPTRWPRGCGGRPRPRWERD